MRCAFAFSVLAACANTVPETRFYQLASSSSSTATPRGTAVLVVEPLETDGAYDDERIVYRTNPYRLDYYQYHRWSTAPGALIASYLSDALDRSGQFRAVVRDANEHAQLALGGRVLAIEEVDRSSTRWVGRIALELRVTDLRSGAVIWTARFEETEPMPAQRPEGLAAALSIAMARIAARVAPQIASLAH